MVPISGHTAHALFDPGDTHSFVSSVFAYKLNQFPESLKFQLIISLPVGIKRITSTRNRNGEVIIGEIRSPTNLIKLEEME